MKHNGLVVFTDGACIHNGKPNAKAAFACVWPDAPKYDVGMRVPLNEPQTNNRAEYKAFMHALEQADGHIDVHGTQPLIVYTDSKLMIDTFTKWFRGWQKNNWRKSDGAKIANVDLIQSIVERMNKRKVTFHHVPAHTGKKDWASVYNDKVDKLARESIIADPASVSHPPHISTTIVPHSNIICTTTKNTTDPPSSLSCNTTRLRTKKLDAYGFFTVMKETK